MHPTRPNNAQSPSDSAKRQTEAELRSPCHISDVDWHGSVLSIDDTLSSGRCARRNAREFDRSRDGTPFDLRLLVARHAVVVDRPYYGPEAALSSRRIPSPRPSAAACIRSFCRDTRETLAVVWWSFLPSVETLRTIAWWQDDDDARTKLRREGDCTDRAGPVPMVVPVGYRLLARHVSLPVRHSRPDRAAMIRRRRCPRVGRCSAP
mmetsp:Transcript_16961/g.36911  ORF Transcript_16961/g.36911 Transcript_16961/m.36911 type:complete len:207 (-) Transcript_16961:84-704(-)